MSDKKSKPFVPHSHTPYGSDGSGFYADNTLGCFNVVQSATPLVLEGIGSTPYNGQGPFTICDYGTADGGISMFLMHDVIGKIKETHGDDTEVMIIYEDQPLNDFKSLFLRVHGLISGPPSYLADYTGVYLSAVGTGFYDQCVPTGSVHVGFSSTAMHWLRERPCTLTGAIQHSMATSEEEKAAFAKQAARDWEDNLLLRAKELAPGGRLVMANLGRDDQNHYLGNTHDVQVSMYDRMTAIWQAMVEEGKITQEEFQNTTVNNYYRNLDEFTAPLKDTSSAVYKAGLRLVMAETRITPCPYRAKWTQEENKDDPAVRRAWAKWFIPTTRTWSNDSFMSGLSEASRTREEREALVDELFQRYEDEAAACPEHHGMEYVHGFIVLQKVAT